MTQKKFDPNDFLHDCGFNQDEIQKEHVDELNEAFKSLENDSVPEINKPNESQLNHIISVAKEQSLFDHKSKEGVENIRQKKNPITSFFSQPVPSYSLVFMTLFGLTVGYQISNVSTVITDNNIAQTDLDENVTPVSDSLEEIIVSNFVDVDQRTAFTKAKRKTVIPQSNNAQDQLIKKLIEHKIDFDFKYKNNTGLIMFIYSDTTLAIVENLDIDFDIERNHIKVEM